MCVCVGGGEWMGVFRGVRCVDVGGCSGGGVWGVLWLYILLFIMFVNVDI